MEIMKKYKYILVIASIIVVGFICANVLNKDEKTAITSTTALSNKSISWGIKRNDNHDQPDLGSQNKALIEKYNGIALGNPEKKNIYLTFDLGYEAGYTTKILDALKENGVQGTFFVTAHYINTASDIVKRMIDEGHIVGNQFPQT